jgi:hypothetical protein
MTADRSACARPGRRRQLLRDYVRASMTPYVLARFSVEAVIRTSSASWNGAGRGQRPRPRQPLVPGRSSISAPTSNVPNTCRRWRAATASGRSCSVRRRRQRSPSLQTSATRR